MKHQNNPRHWLSAISARCGNAAGGFVLAALLLQGSNAFAASLSRTVDLDAPASTVWSTVGPYCAIKDWHPAIGSCSEDGSNPPTRTLTTKDGKTVFVEPETARNEKERFYSYTFKSSPFPVDHYMGTIWVVPSSKNTTTVLWTGTFTPKPGKEKEATDDFANVYDAGLDALKKKYEK